MSAIDRGFESLSLSDSLREALRRRMRELTGVALIVFAMLLVAALASWSVQDPSLSHATNAPARNLLGVPGAIVADLMMQLFGIASVALVLPIAVWGWRLAGHRALYRERLRLLTWIAAVVLTASFAACLPRTAAWPLPAGLGGVTGDALLRFAVWVAGNDVLGIARLIVGVAAGAGASLALALTLGFGWQEPAEVEEPRRRRKVKVADEEEEEQEEEEEAPRRGGWLSLGFFTHGFLSLRARLARWRERRASERRSLRAAPDRPHGRVEPRFGDYQTALHELEMEDGDEEEDEDDETPRARKPRVAAPKPQRRGKYVLPSLDVLSQPKARRTHHALERPHPGQRHRARRRARRLRRARRDHQCAAGSGRHPVRARARARHQIVARDRALRRHRPLHERAVRARRGGLRPQRHRHRTAQPEPREGLSARIARGRRLQRDLGQAAALPRQDHRRRVRYRRPHAHAASVDRGHHRLRQVGRHQHHDPEPALPADAGPVPADHGRSEDARALGLRRDPAFADARRHRPEEGDRRAQMGGARDGRALQEDVEARRAQHRRLQRARRGSRSRRARSSPAPFTPATTRNRARRSTRRRSSTSSRCPTSSSSWTRWPT